MPDEDLLLGGYGHIARVDAHKAGSDIRVLG